MWNIEELKVKLILAGIVILIILGLGWTTKHYYDSNIESRGIIGNLVLANKDQATQIELLTKSKEIDAVTISELRHSVDSLTLLDTQHRNYTNAKVKEILDKYGKLPTTPENIRKRDVEVSQTRLSGLWKTFCVNHPEYEQCKGLKKD